VNVVAEPSDPGVAIAPMPSGTRRVIVLYERCRSGAATLREAAELAGPDGEVAVVTLAPQARRTGCVRCGGVGPYNRAIREEAHLELGEAREILGSAADRATFKVLIERRDPPLTTWVSEQGFDVVLLPGRRLTLGGNPIARKLRRTSGPEIRVVGEQQ
jgi:hypothetical protein